MSPGPGQISMRVGGTINITCWLSEESIKHGYDNSILSFWNDKQREITENIDVSINLLIFDERTRFIHARKMFILNFDS